MTGFKVKDFPGSLTKPTMADWDADTDTLLALVLSTLTGTAPQTDVILDALVRYNGNVEAAVQLLNSGAMTTVQNQKKRKQVDLRDWLKSSAPKTSKRSRDSEREGAEPVVLRTSAAKPPADLMLVLRQPSPPRRTIPQQSPLTLPAPALVAKYTPCTLHPSVLPPELACRLFYTMLDASQGWKRNKWWLFDRLVESPHRTAFYARSDDGIDGDSKWQEAAQFWYAQVAHIRLVLIYSIRYNGRMTDPPPVFPPEMEEACKIVERVVNDELRNRERFPLEWGGSPVTDLAWRANVAASNCYEGAQESVGYHSDQLTYLGPYPTIASLSLGK